MQLKDFLKRIECEVALGHFTPRAKPAGEVATCGGFYLCVANGHRNKPLWAQYIEEPSFRLWVILHPKMSSNLYAGLSEH